MDHPRARDHDGVAPSDDEGSAALHRTYDGSNPVPDDGLALCWAWITGALDKVWNKEYIESLQDKFNVRARISHDLYGGTAIVTDLSKPARPDLGRLAMEDIRSKAFPQLTPGVAPPRFPVAVAFVGAAGVQRLGTNLLPLHVEVEYGIRVVCLPRPKQENIRSFYKADVLLYDVREGMGLGEEFIRARAAHPGMPGQGKAVAATPVSDRLAAVLGHLGTLARVQLVIDGPAAGPAFTPVAPVPIATTSGVEDGVRRKRGNKPRKGQKGKGGAGCGAGAKGGADADADGSDSDDDGIDQLDNLMASVSTATGTGAAGGAAGGGAAAAPGASTVSDPLAPADLVPLYWAPAKVPPYLKKAIERCEGKYGVSVSTSTPAEAVYGGAWTVVDKAQPPRPDVVAEAAQQLRGRLYPYPPAATVLPRHPAVVLKPSFVLTDGYVKIVLEKIADAINKSTAKHGVWAAAPNPEQMRAHRPVYGGSGNLFLYDLRQAYTVPLPTPALELPDLLAAIAGSAGGGAAALVPLPSNVRTVVQALPTISAAVAAKHDETRDKRKQRKAAERAAAAAAGGAAATGHGGDEGSGSEEEVGEKGEGEKQFEELIASLMAAGT